MGFLIGTGVFLEFTSWFRFLFNVLLTPICIIVVYELGVDHEIYLGKKFDIKTQRIIIWMIYVVFFLDSLFTHLTGIQLGIATLDDGLLRYTQLNHIHLISSILVSIIVLIVSIQFGRKTNWKVPRFLIGIIVMILGALIHASKYEVAPGSFVEMMFALSMLVVYHINNKKI